MLYLLQVCYLFEIVHDHFHLVSIVHADCYFARENSLVGLKVHAANVNVELVGYYLGDVMKHAISVYSMHFYGGVKKEFLVHVPLGIEKARSKTRLKFGGYRARAFVYFDVVLAVYESEYVVSGNGVTAMWKEIHVDSVLAYDASLFAIEVFANEKKLVG